MNDNSDSYNDGLSDEHRRPKQLPSDLPTSLDSRIRPAEFSASRETEMYDAWQGQSQILTAPIPARVNFALSPEDDVDIDQVTDNEERLESMLATQTALRQDEWSLQDDAAILSNKALPDDKKRDLLQKSLTMAASNGDMMKIAKLLDGEAKKYVDIDMADEEGTNSLIYAACFGHHDAVTKLLNAGANVDAVDGHNWSALMWATTNRHKDIAQTLRDNGASSNNKFSSKRSKFESNIYDDYLSNTSDLSGYLNDNGYIGTAGMGEDFYDSGLTEERFEEQMMENELKRRMMMESSMNLEVDLSSLGLDEQAESPLEDPDTDNQDFVWDKCLPHQMFVFGEADLSRILDIVITNMQPQRSPSQKPIPANVLFLCARFAHYMGGKDLLAKLLYDAMDRINEIVEEHQWDMTILAFWVSNATLLLHYLKKDAGLVESTVHFQVQLSELINEIYILIVRDAERRINKVLDAAILDHETIPGFEEIQFQNEWRIFRSRKKPLPEPPMNSKRFRPPSPKQKAKPSPRNIISLLSSTLFVLDLYEVHSVIVTQIVSQLFYWLSAETFNRIMSNRRYLARTKAMQIRMNVSMLEDWARTNSRQPENYEGATASSTDENTADAFKKHFEPVVELLQWLQCFSSLGDDIESFKGTLKQLTRLTPEQILHSVKHYRAEVGEKSLPKDAMKYLVKQNIDAATEKRRRHLSIVSRDSEEFQRKQSEPKGSQTSVPSTSEEEASNEAPENLLLDPSLMLPFVLPTLTEMLISYGAGIGGVNRERERKYQPFLPAEFVSKLDANSRSDSISSGVIGHIGPSRWNSGNDYDEEDENEDNEDDINDTQLR